MNKKVIGFKSDKDSSDKLNSYVIKKQITKKEWFEGHLNRDILQSKLELNVREKFVTIPASEYAELLANNPQNHSKIICDRIVDHILSQDVEITFDNLWSETKIFQQMNSIECSRKIEGDIEVIHCNHQMGMNVSIFLVYLAIEMLQITKESTFVSKIVLSNNFILKIKKKVNRG